MDKLEPIDINCPECEASLKVTVEDVARERTVRCSRGHSVDLIDEDHGAKKALKAMEDLDKSIRKLGGKLKFTL